MPPDQKTSLVIYKSKSSSVKYNGSNDIYLELLSILYLFDTNQYYEMIDMIQRVFKNLEAIREYIEVRVNKEYYTNENICFLFTNTDIDEVNIMIQNIEENLFLTLLNIEMYNKGCKHLVQNIKTIINEYNLIYYCDIAYYEWRERAADALIFNQIHIKNTKKDIEIINNKIETQKAIKKNKSKWYNPNTWLELDFDIDISINP